MKRLGDNKLSSEVSAEVNMAPLMDIVFILLIFFIVTTVFVKETGIEVQKPTAASSKNLSKNSIMLALNSDGRIFYAGEEYNINNIRALINREVYNKKVPVIIIADKNSSSGILVDLLDECKLGGAEHVSIATETE